MHSFHQKFTIHPVGQGLFYSCTITHDNAVKFRMIFDCGSNTAQAGQDEVALYRDDEFIKQKTLDLLIISHFDSDHVKHIGLLLQDDIKIKRLVMPLITFEERLFLVVKLLDQSDGYKPEDDFPLRFIADPIGTISNNLDSDSEIYFIENNPNPIPPTNDEIGDSDEGSINDRRFSFDFDPTAKENLDSKFLDSISIPTGVNAYKVLDTKKGKLENAPGSHRLMEFLFYKRTFDMDGAFFKEVEAQFYKKYDIDNSLTSTQKLQAVIEKVRSIKSATPIKEIFKNASDIVGMNGKKGVKIKDLNTTSLCLLHRNLMEIFEFIEKDRSDHIFEFPFYPYNLRRVQKFKSSRIETTWSLVNSYFIHYNRRANRNNLFFPNVLLTSDAFLLKEDQVHEFLNKYKHYWSDIWLFQIPHHGSDKSSGKLLYANIPEASFNFINYGIGNRDGHPSQNVISDLVATGNSFKLIPVNQVTGLIFEFIL